ncbi:MAG: NAD(P)(+) transhydrogenase (Re/Si-specific) subunit alpha, partial [Acidobacteria bacterium]
RNVGAFLLHLVQGGSLQMNRDDEIVRDTLLTHRGKLVNPRVREFFSLPALEDQPTGGTG